MRRFLIEFIGKIINPMELEMNSIIKLFFILLLSTTFNAYAKLNIKEVNHTNYNKTQKQTIQFLNEAIDFYTANGLKKSIKAFSTNQKFKSNHHYIFLVNKSGNIISHGYNVSNKYNIAKIKTMSGENYLNVLFNLAKHPKGGWYTINWSSPVDHQRAIKTIFVKKLPCNKTDCQDMVIGTGYY